jgi:hypothetical protein
VNIESLYNVEENLAMGNKTWCAGHVLLMGSILLGALGTAAVPAMATGDGQVAEIDRLASTQDDDVTPPSIDRDLEPVVVSGKWLRHLWGTPTDELFVYAHRDGGLQQIPFQVDEVEADSYVSTVGNPLDNDDEVAFMASDLGGRLGDELVITTTLPVSSTWYRITVIDPLSTSAKGWAYIVRSNSLTEEFTKTYASFDPVTERITTTEYAAGFLANHPGFDYLALRGLGEDILDRTKIRFYRRFGTLTIQYTEEEFAGPPPIPTKSGPVRVIVDDRSVIGYQSLIQTYLTETVSDTVGARFSTDFNENAIGATFYNANSDKPVEVLIDGIPAETVAKKPLSPWWEVVDDTGTLVHVADSAGVGGTQTNYYKDDDEIDWYDTGDERSYGDTGVAADSPNETVDYRTALFVLPPGLPNVGQQYADYVTHPLVVWAIAPMKMVNHFHLPLVNKRYVRMFHYAYLPLVTR